MHRADREECSLRPHLLNIAEILQNPSFTLPADPERTSSTTTELLFGESCRNPNIVRFTCTLETTDPEVHEYNLSDEVATDEAMALELAPETRAERPLPEACDEKRPWTKERPWNGLGPRVSPHNELGQSMYCKKALQQHLQQHLNTTLQQHIQEGKEGNNEDEWGACNEAEDEGDEQT